MGNLGELVVSISADLARLKSDMGKGVDIVDKASKDMAKALGVVGSSFKLIGAAASALAGGKMFGDIINETVQWNEQARKLGNTFGITTEAASVFETAIAKLGIEHDTAVNAALKLSRTLSQGTDKFDQYGVAVKDSSGKLLSMPEIMANVNQKLLETQSGADRNIIAMALYGRTWGQLKEILRLTPAQMEEAQKTAERLHLIVGPEGVEKTLAYRDSMREFELVSKSMKIQIGNELIPELTRLAAKLSGFAEEGGIADFIHGLHSIEAEFYRLGATIDVLGGTMATLMYYMAGGKFTAFGRWFGEQNAMFLERYKASDKELLKLAYLEVGLDENGNPIKKKAQDLSGDRTDVINKGASKELTANRAYLNYLKSFYEGEAQLQKQANDAEEQANQIAWNWGLVGLKKYLDTKHALNESNLQTELDAKKKELAAAQDVERKAEDMYRRNPSDEVEAKLYKAYDDTQKAANAVEAAESKLQKARVSNADETKRAFYDQQKNLIDLTAQILELSGQYERAAQARIKFFRASPDYLKLAPEEKASRDQLDSFTMFQAGQRQRNEAEGRRISNLALQSSIPDIYGNTDTYGAGQSRYQSELNGVQEEIDKLRALYMEDTQAWQDAQEKKKLITEKYLADQSVVQKRWSDQIVQMQLSAAQSFAELIKVIGQNSKGAAIAALTISKGIALAETFISTQAASMRAVAELGPVAGLPVAGMIETLGYVKMGLIAATGIAEAANISGREIGGPVHSGESYIVGEKGPELFTPGYSGMITPNNKLGGAVVINNSYDFRNASPETEQRMQAEIQKNSEKTKAEILDSMQRGGKFAIASGRMK